MGLDALSAEPRSDEMGYGTQTWVGMEMLHLKQLCALSLSTSDFGNVACAAMRAYKNVQCACHLEEGCGMEGKSVRVMKGP